MVKKSHTIAGQGVGRTNDCNSEQLDILKHTVGKASFVHGCFKNVGFEVALPIYFPNWVFILHALE